MVEVSKSLEVVVVAGSDVEIHKEILGRLRVSAEEFFKVVVELGEFYSDYSREYEIGYRCLADKFGVSKSTVANYIRAYANYYKLDKMNITSITQMNKYLSEEEVKDKVAKVKVEPKPKPEPEPMDSKDKAEYDTAIVSTDERDTLHLEIAGLQRELTTERGRGTRAETKQEDAEKKATITMTRALDAEDELSNSKDDVAYWTGIVLRYETKMKELGMTADEIKHIRLA